MESLSPFGEPSVLIIITQQLRELNVNLKYQTPFRYSGSVGTLYALNSIFQMISSLSYYGMLVLLLWVVS